MPVDPKTPKTPVCPVTWAKNLKIMKKLFKTIGLDKDTRDELCKHRLTSPKAIALALKTDCIKDLEDGVLINLGTVLFMEELAKYLIWYQSTHSNFENLSENFSKEAYETFQSEMVLPDDATKSDVAHVTKRSEYAEIKVRVSDYPKFSGKNTDWPKFYKTFSAVCELQNLSSILNKNTHHEDDFKKDAVYKEKCEVLFSILKKCCAEGMALYKIKKFDESKDGHKAWRRLFDHYHAFGVVNTYATSLMNQLINLKL